MVTPNIFIIPCTSTVDFLFIELKELLPLSKPVLTEWDQFSIYVAAFILAHRGHADVLREILRRGVNLKRELPSGRHPSLVSVERKNLKCAEAIRKSLWV